MHIGIAVTKKGKYIQCRDHACREWYPRPKQSGTRSRCPYCQMRKLHEKQDKQNEKYLARLKALQERGRSRASAIGWGGRLLFDVAKEIARVQRAKA
jgi:hypothetical protein